MGKQVVPGEPNAVYLWSGPWKQLCDMPTLEQLDQEEKELKAQIQELESRLEKTRWLKHWHSILYLTYHQAKRHRRKHHKHS